MIYAADMAAQSSMPDAYAQPPITKFPAEEGRAILP